MRFNLLSDAHWESKLVDVLSEFSSTGFRAIFEARNYGNGLAGITVVFICQDPSLNLKKRLRFSKGERKIYMDVMLDLPTMRQASPAIRKKIVSERLAEEIPIVLRKYNIADFNDMQFVADLNQWLEAAIS